MAVTLRESRSICQVAGGLDFRESRNPLMLQYIRTLRMDKSGQELLRENIRLRLGKRTQRALARAIGKGDATISDFLNGRQHSLDLDLYLPVAKFLGCSVADLFADATKVTYPVQPTGVESSSIISEGAPYGVEADLLRQYTELQTVHETLRRAVKGTVKRLGELVGEQTPPTTIRESGASPADRKSHRRLPEARRLKPKGARR